MPPSQKQAATRYGQQQGKCSGRHGHVEYSKRVSRPKDNICRFRDYDLLSFVSAARLFGPKHDQPTTEPHMSRKAASRVRTRNHQNVLSLKIDVRRRFYGARASKWFVRHSVMIINEISQRCQSLDFEKRSLRAVAQIEPALCSDTWTPPPEHDRGNGDEEAERSETELYPRVSHAHESPLRRWALPLGT